VHDAVSVLSRLTRLYEEDGKAHNGVPSIQRAVFRYVRTRMIASAMSVSLSVSAGVIGPVRKSQGNNGDAVLLLIIRIYPVASPALLSVVKVQIRYMYLLHRLLHVSYCLAV